MHFTFWKGPNNEVVVHREAKGKFGGTTIACNCCVVPFASTRFSGMALSLLRSKLSRSYQLTPASNFDPYSTVSVDKNYTILSIFLTQLSQTQSQSSHHIEIADCMCVQMQGV